MPRVLNSRCLTYSIFVICRPTQDEKNDWLIDCLIVCLYEKELKFPLFA